MSQRQRSASTDQASDHARKVRQPDHAVAPEQHPLLTLQQTVGNRAVQRLVSSLPKRPGVIQRVLSPSTYFLGIGAHGGLLASWAQLSAQTATIQQMAANASAQAQGMLANIGLMQTFIGLAQAEPAPPTAGGGLPMGASAMAGAPVGIPLHALPENPYIDID